MRCDGCGASFVEGQKFWTYCGNSLTEKFEKESVAEFDVVNVKFGKRGYILNGDITKGEIAIQDVLCDKENDKFRVVAIQYKGRLVKKVGIVTNVNILVDSNVVQKSGLYVKY